METRQKSPSVLPLIESEGAVTMTGHRGTRSFIIQAGSFNHWIATVSSLKSEKRKAFPALKLSLANDIETPVVEKGKRKLVIHCFIGPHSPANVCTINENGPRRFKDKM